jgi:GAF domain-containing protein
MVPADISPLETRQFELLLRRSGADPSVFELRKFRSYPGDDYKVRVVGRGAARVYEMKEPQPWIGLFADDLDKGLFGTDSEPELSPTLAMAVHELQLALARQGLQGALGVLNARVPHRFTVVYRLFGQSLHNVATVDKHLHLEALDLKSVPLKESYCQFVLRDGLFLTEQSAADERLQGHPYAGVVGSYVGVPLRDRAGKLAGTLCHFDLQDHKLDDDEYLLLDRAAKLLPAFVGQ